MTVERATIVDRLRVIAMLKSYQDAGNTPFPFDERMIDKLFKLAIFDNSCACFIWRADGLGSSRGVLLAHSASSPFAAVMVAKEVALWVDEDFRGTGAASELVAAYEAWAVGRGCQIIGISAMAAAPGIGGMYERMGFNPVETNYVKVIPAVGEDAA